MFRPLGELFGKKLQTVPHVARKHEKSSIRPKLTKFSSTLPCFCVWVNFSAKSCRKCLMSRKSLRIVDLAKTRHVFEETTMIRRLGELFGQKLHKVPHFAKKNEKSSIWPKLHNFSSRLTCFGIWVNFSAKSCKTCLISPKSMKNRRFGQSLKLFRADYHVSAFG